MRWIKCLSVFLFFAFNAFSQNETQKWYFGEYCGLDFSTSPPTVIPSPVFNSVEGGASISDASGNLLFYSDGMTVWNSTHAVMANGSGLLGNQSSSQSSVIVKQPGSATIYYLFTQEERGLPNGFRYSIVDMSLAAGMGSVTIKNTLLYTPSCEKLSAVKHCNGNDVWIITHDFNSNVFRAILLTAAGISATPVLSAIGPTLTVMKYVSVLKISPNGQKIALPSLVDQNLEMFDFNPGTGVVSNHFTLANIASYGCEFSPDGTKFYAGVDNIYQWDLCAGNTAAIKNSSVTIFTNNLIAPASYQSAPDGKIYISMLHQNSLAVIHNPNLSGTASNFNLTGQTLGTGMGKMGLPNFVVSYFKSAPTFSSTQNCSAVSFTAPSFINSGCGALQTFTASSWLFSDPASGAANSSTLSTVTHTFSAPGIYNVKLLLYSVCGVDTVSKIYNILTAPLVMTPSSSTLCAGSSTTLQVSGADTYSWNTGATASSITTSPMVTTIYTVIGFYSGGCSTKSTATVSVLPAGTPKMDFIYKTPICINDTNPSPDIKDDFNFGGIFYSSPGLTINDSTGHIDLAASSPGTFLITYSIQAKDCFSSGSKTTAITVKAAPSLTVSPNVKMDPDQAATLEVIGGVSYTWSPAIDISCTDCPNPLVSPKVTTIYCVLTSMLGCYSEACINVQVGCDGGGDFSLPNAFSPNNDGNNDSFCLKGWDFCVKHFSVLIFNRWGEKVFESTDPSFCWDGSFKGTRLESEVFIYTIKASFSNGSQINKKGNITLLR